MNLRDGNSIKHSAATVTRLVFNKEGVIGNPETCFPLQYPFCISNLKIKI